ncbi:hypothetical protein [Cellulosimicrobium sp. Marseille-Q4280]|uniref:hypothetical protein n=1 Tax=Cellulosimicrobium sp. Marseille-Q4280 TaxID=2937992 RepID=UPI00203C0C24|nr:hypothetical protein [Cellulosimicrobium sp. Marseille-Q4280]
MPSRSRRNARRALGGALLAVVVHVGPALPASGADAVVDPELLVFDALAPGETSSAVTTLRVDAPSAATIVRADVSAQGELVPHLTTVVESCDEPWTAAGCASGATLLVEGPVSSSDSALQVPVPVPVPATGIVHVRVGMTLSDSAPPDTSGTVVYRLDLVGDDAEGGGTDDGAGGGGGSGGPPLATTGADVAAIGAAALALVALGAVLHRGRRPTDRGETT